MENQKNNLTHQRYLLAWLIVLLSASYLITTTLWVLKEPSLILTLMELQTILSALAILYYFTILYHQTPPEKHPLALFSLLLTTAMATITIANHFIYITVITPTYGTLKNTPTTLRLDSWPSITKALECVSWAAMLGLSMLLLSYALKKEEQITKWILRISGILIIAGLIGPITQNMQYYFLSTIGYTLGFLVLSLHDIYKQKKTQQRN